MELPHDIMFEIFSTCLSNKTVKLPLGRSTAPLNLTHVCSTWRQAAMEMPSLWNNVAIKFDHNIDADSARGDMLGMFLSRTGSSLISLEITLEGSDGTELLCENIVRLILPYSRRLHRLVLLPWRHFYYLLELPAGNVNALEDVNLKFSPSPRFYHSSRPMPNITLFHLAPSLRRLSISSWHTNLDLSACHFPWSQLNHLAFNEISLMFEEGHAVLRQCVNMISCSLTIVSDANCQTATVMPDTSLDRLQTLKIDVCCYGLVTFGEFLRPFIVPSLKHLGVYMYSNMSVTFLDVALSLLVQRSSCQLDHFEARCLDPTVRLVG